MVLFGNNQIQNSIITTYLFSHFVFVSNLSVYRSTDFYIMLTIDDVLTIAEEVATALYDKLTDDGKISVIDAIQLAILLIRLISRAVKK